MVQEKILQLKIVDRTLFIIIILSPKTKYRGNSIRNLYSSASFKLFCIYIHQKNINVELFEDVGDSI